MHDRSALGPADVTDTELASKVAALWEVPHVDLLSSATLPVAYDVPSITTSARTWVVGTADAGAGPRGFRLFEVDDERLHNGCAARAALASYSLDLLAATAP